MQEEVPEAYIVHRSRAQREQARVPQPSRAEPIKSQPLADVSIAPLAEEWIDAQVGCKVVEHSVPVSCSN